MPWKGVNRAADHEVSRGRFQVSGGRTHGRQLPMRVRGVQALVRDSESGPFARPWGGSHPRGQDHQARFARWGRLTPQEMRQLRQTATMPSSNMTSTPWAGSSLLV